MFIKRDYTRTEEDDFKLNVLPRLDSCTEVVEVYGALHPAQFSASIPDPILGWTLKPRYE
jgi:hypothetical protein